MKQENKDNLYLRIYVSGGGCSGLSYGMGFEEKVDEDDAVINKNGVQVIVDSYSQKYLNRFSPSCRHAIPPRSRRRRRSTWRPSAARARFRWTG